VEVRGIKAGGHDSGWRRHDWSSGCTLARTCCRRPETEEGDGLLAADPVVVVQISRAEVGRDADLERQRLRRARRQHWRAKAFAGRDAEAQAGSSMSAKAPQRRVPPRRMGAPATHGAGAVLPSAWMPSKP
jgi:hypothetical protein